MRFWKRFRRVLLAVIGSLLVTTIYFVVKREISRHQGERELAAAIAEMGASDPRWQWDDIQADRFRPPEDQNGAPLISKIKSAITPEADKLWRELVDVANPDEPANVRLRESVLSKARDSLAASGDAVLLARTLKDRPHGFREIRLAQNPLDTLLPNTQSTRDVANVLRWSLSVSVENGEYTRAADELIAAMNTSRSIGDEPFMISQLVRIATRSTLLRSVERVIAQTSRPADLTALRLPAIQEALTRDADEPLLLYGVRGDRAMFDVLIQRLGEGSLDFGQIGGLPPGSISLDARVGLWFYRGRLPGDRAFCLKWMSFAVAAGRLPIHEQPAAFAELPAVVRDKDHLIIGLLLPAVDRVAAAFWQDVAESRSAVAGIACERFRLKHNRWPNSLTELCPEFLQSVPLDPFNGEPLSYQKLPDGVVIHSAGQNSPRTPPHPGLPHGIEIGFRLWNTDDRRLPPPPDPPAPKEGDDR